MSPLRFTNLHTRLQSMIVHLRRGMRWLTGQWKKAGRVLIAWWIVTFLLGYVDMSLRNVPLSIATLCASFGLLAVIVYRHLRAETEPLAVFVLPVAGVVACGPLVSGWGIIAEATTEELSAFGVLFTYMVWLFALAAGVVTWVAHDLVRSRRDPKQLALRFRCQP